MVRPRMIQPNVRARNEVKKMLRNSNSEEGEKKGKCRRHRGVRGEGTSKSRAAERNPHNVKKSRMPRPLIRDV